MAAVNWSSFEFERADVTVEYTSGHIRASSRTDEAKMLLMPVARRIEACIRCKIVKSIEFLNCSIAADAWAVIIDALVSAGVLRRISIAAGPNADLSCGLIRLMRHCPLSALSIYYGISSSNTVSELLIAAKSCKTLRWLIVNDRCSNRAHDGIKAALADLMGMRTLKYIEISAHTEPIESLAWLIRASRSSWPLCNLTLELNGHYRHWIGGTEEYYGELGPDVRTIMDTLGYNHRTQWACIRPTVMEVALILRRLLTTYEILWVIDWLPLICEPLGLDPNHSRKVRLIDSVRTATTHI
jgi:hypothetical protein